MMKSKRWCAVWVCAKSLAACPALLWLLAGATAQAQQPPQEPPPDQKAAVLPAESKTPSAVDKAWSILRDATSDSSTDKRVKATQSLGLVSGNAEAERMALKALQDEKANLRSAGATALGSMGALQARKPLEAALQDDDPAVVLAAAAALLLLKDEAGYGIYYEILTGERKANKGFVKGQLSTLKDKKRLAEIGLDEGIGFIPFAGIPYGVLKAVLKDDTSGVRAAAAARKLAEDPDPGTREALEGALKDKNWVIRAAALEALSQRGDAASVSKVIPLMDDEKEDVKYRAAACALHLVERSTKRKKTPAAAAPAKPAQSNR
jgi:HEAT repeat protein